MPYFFVERNWNPPPKWGDFDISIFLDVIWSTWIFTSVGNCLNFVGKPSCCLYWKQPNDPRTFDEALQTTLLQDLQVFPQKNVFLLSSGFGIPLQISEPDFFRDFVEKLVWMKIWMVRVSIQHLSRRFLIARTTRTTALLCRRCHVSRTCVWWEFVVIDSTCAIR